MPAIPPNQPIKLPSVQAVKPRVGRNILFVLLTIGAIILALAGLIAFGIAETGIIKVPLMSVFYKGAAPVRVVNAEPIKFEAFTRLLEQRLAPQALNKAQGYHLTISEKELTSALRGGIANALRSQTATARDIQIAIEPEYVELTGTITDASLNWHMRVRMVPKLTPQGIGFDFTDLRIGDVPIHPSIAARIAGALFSRDLGSWNVQLGSLSIRRIDLARGALTLELSP